MSAFFAWLVSTEVSGVLTWVGTVLGLGGLFLTYRQSRDAKIEAKNAAKQASLATEAVKAYEQRLALAGLAEGRARLQVVISAIRSKEFAVARVHCDVLTRDLEHVFQILVQDASGSARRSLSALSKQVDKGLGESSALRQSVVDKAADGLVGFLTKAQIEVTRLRDPKGVDDEIP